MICDCPPVTTTPALPPSSPRMRADDSLHQAHVAEDDARLDGLHRVAARSVTGGGARGTGGAAPCHGQGNSPPR